MTELDLSGHELLFPRREEALLHMLDDFHAWLQTKGYRVLKPTNMWEVTRYRQPFTKGHSTGIIYRKQTGALTYVGPSGYDMKEFVKGAPLTHAEKCSPPSVFKQVDFAKLEKKHSRTTDRPKKEQRKREERIARKKTNRRTAIGRLIIRDGSDCWYCAQPLGNDITKEHLIPKSDGGANTQENLVLAHERCNQMAGNMPLPMKHALREYLRAKSVDTPKKPA